MESRRDEKTYLVFCGEEVAKSLIAAGYITWLQSQFPVLIEYVNSVFLVHRHLSDLQMHQYVKHYLIFLVNNHSLQQTGLSYCWFWLSGSCYVPYEAAVSEQIEQAFKERRTLVLQIKNSVYNIDPLNMTVTNAMGKNQTMLHRQTETPQRPPEHRPPYRARGAPSRRK